MTNLMNDSRIARATISEFLVKYGAYGTNSLSSDSTSDEIYKTFYNFDVKDRVTYKNWVSQYKEVITIAANMQRNLKIGSKKKGAYHEQSFREGNRGLITDLIMLRRASKIAAEVSYRLAKLSEEAAA